MGDVGECQTSNKKDYDKEDDDVPAPALDEGDIALLKTYGLGPYTTAIKDVEKDITEAKVGPSTGCTGSVMDQSLVQMPSDQHYLPVYFYFTS